MEKPGAKSIKVHARAEEFDAVAEFVTQVLSESSVSGEIARDVGLVFETLFGSILAQGAGPDTVLEVSEHKRFGSVRLTIGFEGDRYNPRADIGGFDSQGAELLRAYDDKIDYGYQLGCNSIVVSIRRRGGTWILSNIGAMLIGIVVYAVMANTLDQQAQDVIARDYLYYIGTLFSSAALMISAPVTLFSLLKNAAEAFIIEKRYSNVRRLWFRVFGTSVGAVLLAMIMGWFLSSTLDVSVLVPSEHTAATLSLSFADIIAEIVPKSIVEPLETMAPLPLIVLSVMCTYALCSVGEHFDVLKKGIDACYALFARMLNLVFVALPFFGFLAVLYTLLADGPRVLLSIFLLSVIILLSLFLLLFVYALRLGFSRVKLTAFMKGLPALLSENLKINSAIGAVPFNVRYCSKTYGMDRRRLARDLPVLAQVNRDGNCYLLMMVALMAVFPNGVETTSMLEIDILALLVLFLSLGAPNQPGGILVGTVIIANYLNMHEMWILGVFLEVFLGRAQNAANVLGDIVMVAIDDAKDKAKAKGRSGDDE